MNSWKRLETHNPQMYEAIRAYFADRPIENESLEAALALLVVAPDASEELRDFARKLQQSSRTAAANTPSLASMIGAAETPSSSPSGVDATSPYARDSGGREGIAVIRLRFGQEASSIAAVDASAAMAAFNQAVANVDEAVLLDAAGEGLLPWGDAHATLELLKLMAPVRVRAEHTQQGSFILAGSIFAARQAFKLLELDKALKEQVVKILGETKVAQALHSKAVEILDYPASALKAPLVRLLGRLGFETRSNPHANEEEIALDVESRKLADATRPACQACACP